MTLLAAFAVLLGRYSGQNDVVIGTAIAHRQDEALADLIGCFVNALALRVRVDETQSVAALLRAVRQTTLAAYEHQDIPFERVVEAVAPARSLNRSPIYQVVLSLQNAPWTAPQLAELDVAPVAADRLRVRYDIELQVWEHEGQITFRMVLQRGAVRRMADCTDGAALRPRPGCIPGATRRAALPTWPCSTTSNAGVSLNRGGRRSRGRGACARPRTPGRADSPDSGCARADLRRTPPHDRALDESGAPRGASAAAARRGPEHLGSAIVQPSGPT